MVRHYEGEVEPKPHLYEVVVFMIFLAGILRADLQICYQTI